MSDLKKSELKGPDAFQVRMFSVLNWFAANKKQLGLILLPVVLVALGGAVWQAVSGKVKESRMGELARIEDQFSAEAEAAFKKADAAAQAAGKVKPDHSASLEKYIAFAKSNPGNEEGWIASIRAANIKLDKDQPTQEDLESALKLIEPVLSKSVASPFHQTTALMISMSILEDLKRYDDAMKHAATLIASVPDDVKPRILLAKARIQIAKAASNGTKEARDEAQATLNTIIEKHGSSDEAGKARVMLTNLTATATN